MNNLLLSAESLSAIVDIVALVFLVGSALLGFIRGFAKTFVSAFGTIISLLLAVVLSGSVAAFLEEKFLFATTIADGLKGIVNTVFGEKLMNSTLDEVSNQMLVEAGGGGFILSLILAFKNDLSIPTNVTLGELICPTLSYYIVLIISVIILFALFKILMFLVGEVVVKLHSAPLIRNSDKILGLILGFFVGITHAQVIFMVIGVIPLSIFQEIYSGIQFSVVANFIESINIYSKIMNVVSMEEVISFVKSMI